MVTLRRSYCQQLCTKYFDIKQSKDKGNERLKIKINPENSEQTRTTEIHRSKCNYPFHVAWIDFIMYAKLLNYYAIIM